MNDIRTFMLSSEEKEKIIEGLNWAKHGDARYYTIDDIKEGTPDHNCATIVIGDSKHINLGYYDTSNGFAIAHVRNGKFDGESKPTYEVNGYIELKKK